MNRFFGRSIDFTSIVFLFILPVFALGGANGIVSFLPQEIRDNPVMPPVVITSLKRFGIPSGSAREYSSGEEIRLRHDENFFSIEFATLDFSSPEKNQYRYKLEGLDSDWSQADTRSYATYTNVSPGKYTFRVQASNNDGIWNARGASIVIFVVPPLWATWWAITLYIVGGVTAITNADSDPKRQRP